MLPDISKLFFAEKAIVGKPTWQHSDSTWFRLTCSFEVNGEIPEGMELRGKALQTIPDRAVCFHLQYYPARGPCTPLARAEWRPLSPHTNPNVGKYPLLRIEGSHIHAFELNWLAELGRMRAGNLVIARPLNPDAATLDEFLAIVGKEFRIKLLNVIERPPWRLGDLFGI